MIPLLVQIECRLKLLAKRFEANYAVGASLACQMLSTLKSPRQLREIRQQILPNSHLPLPVFQGKTTHSTKWGCSSPQNKNNMTLLSMLRAHLLLVEKPVGQRKEVQQGSVMKTKVKTTFCKVLYFGLERIIKTICYYWDWHGIIAIPTWCWCWEALEKKLVQLPVGRKRDLTSYLSSVYPQMPVEIMGQAVLVRLA